ncbi:AraC family transcriptional regulator [Kiritimatiellaeota bacterium B1221]|nr:AraC family transcriptional regulator [Kiritimatiellaeota bacterium B1221]
MQNTSLPRLDLSECRAQLIWANERELEPRHLHMRASFEDVSVCWYIESGSVTVTDPQERVKAGAGEWVFPGRTRAEQYFSPRARILSFRFLLTYPGGDPLFLRERSYVLKSESCPLLEQAGRELIRQLHPWSSSGPIMVGRQRIPLDENFRIEAAFYQWLAAYTQCQHRLGEQLLLRRQGDARVQQALIRLERFSFHEGFSEAELARECGLSVNQLNRLFKRENGLSPFQYYDRLRLERAQQALSETRLQVKEIAYELGFSSSPHFTNWFKQREGMGPRSYRNQAVGNV